MKTITIGRDATNSIVLNEATVSRMHAQLIIIGDGRILIKDLGSSNGTSVNGNNITEQFLNAGDIVKCGSSYLNWSFAIDEDLNGNSFLTPNLGSPPPDLKPSIAAGLIDIDNLRHEKEKTYYIVKLVFSCIFWFFLVFLPLIFSGALFFLMIPAMIIVPFIVLSIWLGSLSLKAVLYGNSVKVNSLQFPHLHNISNDYAIKLGLQSTPEMFICNSNGLINAMAIRAFSKRYVILMSSMVDLMQSGKNNDAISMIIGHEVAHHAAGHTNFWKNLFLIPGSLVPFLGAAYSRACEFTADRIGLVLTNNLEESQHALVALALGSERLFQKSNIPEFCNQENDIPDFVGFVQKIFSGHPRITKRVIEITSYGHKIKM